MTPSWTRGVASFAPGGIESDHTTRRFFTLSLVICFRGLNPKSSYVRLHVSQSPTGGLLNIASVTGVIVLSGLRGAGHGGNTVSAATPPPGAFARSCCCCDARAWAWNCESAKVTTAAV